MMFSCFRPRWTGLVVCGALGFFGGALTAVAAPARSTVITSSLRTADKNREIPVTLMREGGIGPILPNARIRLNGREVASLSPGEKITLYVPPGRAVFGIGAWSTERKFTQHISAGATQRFRIGMTSDNRFVMTRVTDFSR